MEMTMDIDGHLEEEELERYSLAASAEPELSKVEEHLLLCPSCRKKVETSDVYVHSMRHAAAQVRAEEKRAPRWAGMAFLLAATVLLAGVVLIRSHAPVPFAVSLAATRGVGINAQAPAGVPLALQLDVTGLPAAASYRVEMVDHVGKQVWTGTFPGSPAKAAPAGIYFVRLYSPAGDLLREYGLEIGPLLK
jgi:predicted anti-sigma-YlaC factor YlaD